MYFLCIILINKEIFMKHPIDKLIAKVVFGISNFKENHNRIKAMPEESQSNEPLYAMEMIYDYRLKKFSSYIDEAWVLLDKIKEKNYRYEIGEKFGGSFYISLWLSDYERYCEIRNVNNIPLAISLASLVAYDYDIDTISIDGLSFQYIKD